MLDQIRHIDDLIGKTIPLTFEHVEGKGWRYTQVIDRYRVIFVPHRNAKNATTPSLERPTLLCKVMWPPLVKDEPKRFCLIGVEILGPA